MDRLEDRVRKLEIEAKSFDRQMALMTWARIIWLAAVATGFIYLAATHPAWDRIF